MVATSVWVLTIYRRVGISLPPPLVSRGRLAGSCPRDYCPPCFPSFLALPLFLPILPLHSPSTRRPTKRKWVSNSTITATSLPDANKPLNLQCFQSSVCLGTSLRVYRIAFAWSQLQQRERQWQRAYRRRPTALETQEKTTETEARSSPATVYACTVPGWSIPGKIWMPTNQIRAISPRAHVSRELRARALQASRGI